MDKPQPPRMQRLTVVALVVAFSATLAAAVLGGTAWGRRRDD